MFVPIYPTPANFALFSRDTQASLAPPKTPGQGEQDALHQLARLRVKFVITIFSPGLVYFFNTQHGILVICSTNDRHQLLDEQRMGHARHFSSQG